MSELENGKKNTDVNNLPCELIEDLLPMYVDELTSPITNQAVEEHIGACENCNRKYKLMKHPVSEKSQKEVKEIDFLKKTKKKTRKKIILWAALIWFVAVTFVCFTYFFSGKNMNPEYLSYHLDVTGKDLSVAVSSTSNQGIQHIEINEVEGVVEITVRGVPNSLIFKGSRKANYTASEEIRQVWIGNRIIWANGEPISNITGQLYNLYNPYVGNMPSNGKIVNALNMTAFTGSFQNELQTKNEPYAWKMILQNDFSENRQEVLEERLKMYAYILLAEIGNLSEVEYEYKIEGQKFILIVDEKQASEFAGVDIKTVGEDINKLENLVRKTGLSNVVFADGMTDKDAMVDFSFDGQADKVMVVTVVNFAEDKVYGLGLDVNSGSREAEQAMCNANGSALLEGENLYFQIIPADFSGGVYDGDAGKIELSVMDQDGKMTKVQGEVYADLIWGTNYRVYLTGNAKDGYFIGK
ncbi:MAG: DUF4825 domain-containing protein [Lachnospiraceae bacterium]